MQGVPPGQSAEAARVRNAISSEAAQRGLAVGRAIGAGGYSVVFEVMGRPAVLKVPWVAPTSDPHPDVVEHGRGPNHVELVGETGPFVLRGVATVEQAASLLATACAKQQEAKPGAPLAQLIDTHSIGGRIAALYERVDAPEIRALPVEKAREALPWIAEALLKLHATFGPHGDLKPAHVFVDRSRVTFIDPLVGESWLGSIGYALPMSPTWGGDGVWFRDVMGLAATAAELYAVQLPWGGRLAYSLVNQNNGRFGGALDLDAIAAQTVASAADLPEAVRRMIAAVVERFVAGWHGTSPAPSADERRAMISALM